MPKRRIIYRTWLTDAAAPPTSAASAHPSGDLPLVYLAELPDEFLSTEHVAESQKETERQQLLRDVVSRALKHLPQPEREFIEQYYFEGTDYEEMSIRSGRAAHSLVSIHSRALRRLRKELAETVQRLYGIPVQKNERCIICQSVNRRDIDRLLAERDHTQPWGPMMRQLRNEFSLTITKPQIIISHEKYH